MTAQDSPVDVETIRQAFVEILLRRKAEAAEAARPTAAAPEDPDAVLESLAGLFEPDADPGPDENAKPAAATTGPPTTGPAVDPAWKAFLATYGREWNGKKDTWVKFRGWIEHFAKDRGLSRQATNFLNEAEQHADEAARIKFFAGHGVVIETGKGADAAEPVAPTKAADGRPVDMVVSTTKESDSSGDYLWVRVADELGKIYLKGNKFVAADNPALAGIPTRDNRNRRISQVKAGTPGADLTVRIGELWGLLNATTGAFTAQRPDDSAFTSDWSKRTLTEDGYTEGTITLTGRWYQPWDDQQVYLFWRSEDEREWAKGAQLSATALGGVQQKVEDVVKDWAKPFPDEL